MKSLLLSATAAACLAGFVRLITHHARKARPITAGRHNPLAHGVRIALTDDELITAASFSRSGLDRGV